MSHEGLYGSSTAQNAPRLATAEFIGTFFLVFTGTAEAVASALKLTIAGQPADSLAIGLTFGLTLTAMVYTFGHISGCHLNPAVTLGLAVTGKFPWKHAAYYIASQLAGALTASLTVWGTFGERARRVASLAATQPTAHSTSLDVLVIETIMTFLLVLVICSVATDKRAHPAVAGIAVGFTLAACVLVAGPVSGGAINPARALGPMIVAAKYKALWAYILGPVLGGVLGAVVYDKFLATAEDPAIAAAPGAGTRGQAPAARRRPRGRETRRSPPLGVR